MILGEILRSRENVQTNACDRVAITHYMQLVTCMLVVMVTKSQEKGCRTENNQEEEATKHFPLRSIWICQYADSCWEIM